MESNDYVLGVYGRTLNCEYCPITHCICFTCLYEYSEVMKDIKVDIGYTIPIQGLPCTVNKLFLDHRRNTRNHKN